MVDRIAEIEARLQEISTPPWDCMSEQGRNGILWTIFKSPICDYERVASISSSRDALFFMNAPADIRFLLDKVRDHEKMWQNVADNYNHMFPDRPWNACPHDDRTIMYVFALIDENKRLREALTKEKTYIEKLQKAYDAMTENFLYDGK